MSEAKQVKVDNWGIYFLQRLKHFFNRTDYCDLTLQFQDNAQLKVHRLVLSACTEYFELLERTCEMYEDCLVMPDDLQADVVVPIVNFMYTGQLEYKIDLLEKLYQTSLIMNMPVLTKLLASHRSLVQQPPRTAANYYGKRYVKQSKSTHSSSNATNKRTFSSAFSNTETPKSKKPNTTNKIETPSNSKNSSQDLGESQVQFPIFYDKNNQLTKGSRPTRYELPEELEEDNIYDNSFTSISYTSKPLMVHPDTTKQYRSKRINLFEEGSSTSRFMHNNDIVECRKISVNSNIFLDDSSDMVTDENDLFQQSPSNKEEIKDTNQLFDQIIENDVSNITIETKNKESGSLDHAKIISEVLKKYPHLVKSNKQIKLKILNTAANKTKKPKPSNPSKIEEKEKIKHEPRDFTYETDVIDSKEAARLIALGAENVRGPWICLICGTPGKALHFTKYYNFRKHLVEVHNEKPVPNICEYCGLKSQKRNYLVYHQLTKHGVEPPSHYNFPKCNYCDYIALNEALLVKHKITHTDISNYKRNICNASFAASLMDGVQKSNNKHASYEKKNNLACMYCLRVFLRQNNLYAHLKTNHKEAAKNDGLIYDSEEENAEEEEKIYKSKSNDITNFIKLEVPVNYEYEDVQYQLERRPDGNIHVVSKKPRVVMPASKHKILNPGFITQQQTLPSLVKPQQKTKTLNTPTKRNEFIQEICLSPSNNANQEEIVVIDNNEYIVRDYQLFPKTSSAENKEESIGTLLPTTSMEFHNVQNQIPETKMFIKKSTNLNQPLQIVVSSEEEYKTLMNSNQSVIFNDTDSGKTLTVLAASDNSTMEAGTINLSNAQTNEMMIIPEDFAINVSETVSGDNSNIVVVYSHAVENQNKQYQLIATQEVGLEFVQSSEILTQSFETVTTCSTVATTQTGEPWPNNIQATISKLPITSAADLQTMTVAESVTVPCETLSSNSNVYPNITLPTNEPVHLDTNVIEAQEQHQSDVVINNIAPSIESSCETKADMVLDQQLIEDNNIHQPPITEPDVQSSVDCVQTTVITDLISTPAVRELPTMSQHSDLGMVHANPQDTTTTMNQPEPVINVIVPELEIQHTAGIDNIESVIENANIDVDTSNAEMCPENTDTLLSSDGHIVSQDMPIVADVVNEIQSIEVQTHEQTTEEMEVAETIENIARDVGVEPNTINKEIQSDMPQILSNTETINSENIMTIKTVVTNEQIQSLTSEWSEDESEIAAESVPNGENVNSEHGNENIAELSNDEHVKSDLMNDDKLIEVEESIENIQHEIQKHAPQKIIAKTENINTIPDVNVTIAIEEPRNKESNVETPIISNPKISSLLHDWDDNDSQEEDSKVTEIKIEEPTPIIENNDFETIKEEKDGISNNDKIKSLVSDWDEDEEDNKD